jgi:endo-beta-N-acetylglucosaminidase D
MYYFYNLFNFYKKDRNVNNDLIRKYQHLNNSTRLINCLGKNVHLNILDTLTTQQSPQVSVSTPVFHIKDLSKWTHENDEYIQFNKSNISLNSRINKSTNKILAIFEQEDAYYQSQGSNKFNILNFDYWQYIDIFCYWSAHHDKGIIVPPPGHWIDTAHKNGVKIYGLVFFPPEVYGGKIEWVKDLMGINYKDPFWGAKKLITMAKIYDFDGWFINQETEGCTSELSVQIQKFLIYIQENSSIEIMWYDSMSMNGTINYQNELNKYNSHFIQSDDKRVSTSIFTNYWWNKEGVENSVLTAKLLKRDCSDVYTGINAFSEGFSTGDRIKTINNETSIGLFGAEWPYLGIKNIKYEDFYERQNKFWNIIGHYKEANSSILNTPFVTYFNTGQGKKYFIDGSKVSDNEWNDIGQQDYMPTWRQLSQNSVNININYDNAYNGGSSIQFIGTLKDSVIIDLFKTNLISHKGFIMTVHYKYLFNYNLCASIVIEYDDNSIKSFKLNVPKIYNKWTTTKTCIPDQRSSTISTTKKAISKISLKLSKQNIDKLNLPFDIIIGGLKITKECRVATEKPQGLKLSRNSFNSIVSWKKNCSMWYCYIYNIIVTKNKTYTEFIGRTSNNIYQFDGCKQSILGPKISDIEKKDDVIYSLISVKSVSFSGDFCEGDSCAILF